MLDRTSWSSVFLEARSRYTPCNYLNAIQTVGQIAAISTWRCVIKLYLSHIWKGSAMGFIYSWMKNPLTSSEPSLGFIGLALSRPMTVPWSVFQCSLWTSPNRKSETHSLRSRRSFSRQILKVLPWNRHSLSFQLCCRHTDCIPSGCFFWRAVLTFLFPRLSQFRKAQFVTSVELRYTISSHPCCQFWGS